MLIPLHDQNIGFPSSIATICRNYDTQAKWKVQLTRGRQTLNNAGSISKPQLQSVLNHLCLSSKVSRLYQVGQSVSRSVSRSLSLSLSVCWLFHGAWFLPQYSPKNNGCPRWLKSREFSRTHSGPQSVGSGHSTDAPTTSLHWALYSMTQPVIATLAAVQFSLFYSVDGFINLTNPKTEAQFG